MVVGDYYIQRYFFSCNNQQENILAHMHFLLAKNEHDDACTAKHCISHQKFAMQIIEQVSVKTV